MPTHLPRGPFSPPFPLRQDPAAEGPYPFPAVLPAPRPHLHRARTGSPIVGVVDPDAAGRRGVKQLLGALGHTVLTADNGQSLLDTYRPQGLTCLISEWRLPDMTALALRQVILDRWGYCPPFVVLTSCADPAIAAGAIKAGALDYLLKPANPNALLDVVQAALQLDEQQRALLARRHDLAERLRTLSPREHQVLAHLLAGKTNKQIGVEMDLSAKTVHTHRSEVLDKLGFGSLISLALALAEVSPAGPAVSTTASVQRPAA